MHYVARSPPGQAAAAVQVVAAVGGRLQPPFPPPPPQRPVVAGVRVARTELLGGRAGQTLYGQQQQQPPQQQHHHRHPMPTLTLTKMPPMSSLQEKFVAFVMCDFTPRHPSELPTTEWASMVKVPRGQRPSSAPAPPQGAPGGSGQLGTQKEAGRLSAQPPPRAIELAICTAFDHSGGPATATSSRPSSHTPRWRCGRRARAT